MAVNLRTIAKIVRAVTAVQELVEAARPRGDLAECKRQRVAHVSRTGKWLLRALGHMIHDDKSLLANLPEYAVKPDPTNDELDQQAAAREAQREQERGAT